MYFTDIQNVLDETAVVYAHRRADGSREFLREHIQRCWTYFEKICADKEIEKIIVRYSEGMLFENDAAAASFFMCFMILER